MRNRLRTFFGEGRGGRGGESAKKTLDQAHPELQEHQLGSAKKRMNSDLGENLKASTGKINDLLHSPLGNTFFRGKQRS